MKNEEYSSVYKHRSRMFNKSLIGNTDKFSLLRNTIFNSIPIFKNQKFVLDRYKKCIDLILINLYIASKMDCHLMFPMNSDFRYKHPICDQNRNNYSLARCKEIFETMENIDLIKIYKGFQAKKGFKSGRLTRIVINDQLRDKFDLIGSLPFTMGTTEWCPIIVRDEKKRIIEDKNITFEDKKIIKKLSITVNSLNKIYKETKISCHIPISILDNRLQEKLKDLLVRCLIANQIIILTDNKIYDSNLSSMNNINEINQDTGININNNNIYKYIYLIYRDSTGTVGNCLDLLQKLGISDSVNFIIVPKNVYRVFTQNFRNHGRFYGPMYQQMTKEFRKYIKIDDEKTVELDYNAMHIRMLYHAMKIDYRDDPYLTPSGKGRDFMKKIALIAINSSNREQCIRAITHAFNNMGRTINWDGVEQLLDLFINNNKPIQSAFYSGKWKSLTFADATIMNNILVELMNREIIGLPIHDSIIVKKKHESILRQIMIDKYKEQFGFEPII